jgi:F1F0 ATPase subunit 2
VDNLLSLGLALGGGIGLGIFYFGGLWMTVQRIPTARRPVFMSLSSFFGRLAVVLAGFFLVMGGHWERLLVCLLGFLGVRFVLVRRWGPQRRGHDLSAR